jgi:hypothetical protein
VKEHPFAGAGNGMRFKLRTKSIIRSQSSEANHQKPIIRSQSLEANHKKPIIRSQSLEANH